MIVVVYDKKKVYYVYYIRMVSNGFSIIFYRFFFNIYCRGSVL